jgi:hypothetical protein
MAGRPGPQRRTRAIGALALVLTIALGCAGLALAHPEPNDIDGDTRPNATDNCVSVWNFDQADADADGVGNRCDPDYDGDGDGIPNGYPTPVDNCPTKINADQADSNGDGVGDACAIDSDGDTIFDFADNCSAVPNRFQGNTDGDDFGDACDDDIDGDGPPYSQADLRNQFDNCPTVFNPDQRDDDKDGLGALCDADDVPQGTTTTPGTVTAPGTMTPGVTPGPQDVTKPVVTVRLARTWRFDEIRDGLVVGLRCSEACSLTARLTIDKPRARRLRLASTGIVGSGSAQVEAAASTYAFVRFTKAARRVLFRQRRVPASLRVTAVDRAGNTKTATRAVTLRR